MVSLLPARLFRIACFAGLALAVLAAQRADAAGFGVPELLSADGGDNGRPLGASAAIGKSGSAVSRNGQSIYFTTSDRLTGNDSDSASDLYWSLQGTTFLVSVGTADPVTYGGSSADGQDVYFETAERLRDTDTDNAIDVYMRQGGQNTIHVSRGDTASLGNAERPAHFEAVSADGSVVILRSTEGLDGRPSPANNLQDGPSNLYMRANGHTTLLTGNANPRYVGLEFVHLSEDGSRVYFESTSSHASTDTDFSGTDVYRWEANSITHVSQGTSPTLGQTDHIGAFFGAETDDGARVFFDSPDRHTTDDTDNQTDVYAREAGQTTRVTTGSRTGSGNANTVGGFSGFADFVATSPDGARVIFSSRESLADSDLDLNIDAYIVEGGVTRELAVDPQGVGDPGPTSYVGGSRDLSRAFFTTTTKLLPADGDTLFDVYERHGDQLNLITEGTAAAPTFLAASADGTRVFVRTTEKLLPSDTDTGSDIYMYEAGLVYAVNPGPGSVSFLGISFDGSTVYYQTNDSLAPGDTNVNKQDIYRSTFDAIPPQTTIVISPPASTESRAAHFEYGPVDAGTTFVCSLDMQPVSCPVGSVDFDGLALGPHVFTVAATDYAGNTDTTPAVATWTIVEPASQQPPADDPGAGAGDVGGTGTDQTTPVQDQVAPETLKKRGPKRRGTRTRLRFRFASEPGAVFICRLDDEQFEICTSPAVRQVEPGRHKFSAVAIDSAGNLDLTPAVWKFRVLP